MGDPARHRIVNNQKSDSESGDQPEVRLSVGTYEVDVLAHVASRIH